MKKKIVHVSSEEYDKIEAKIKSGEPANVEFYESVLGADRAAGILAAAFHGQPLEMQVKGLHYQAWYSGTTLEFDSTSLLDAKKYAIKYWRVPKNRQHLIHVELTGKDGKQIPKTPEV